MEKMKNFVPDTETSNSESENEPEDHQVNQSCANCQLIGTLYEENKYILQLTATCETNPNVAYASSDNSCVIASLSNQQFCKLHSLSRHKSVVTGVQFSTDNNDLLYTSSNDGSVILWDLRQPEYFVKEFRDKRGDKNQKSFSCFDISPNNKLLAVGTELFEGDAFILFWDLRQTSLMGGYWESHTDDITHVKFHPNDSNKLISGSIDGLINLYDLSQKQEDDALTDSLNTECSVEKLNWIKLNRREVISCVSQNAEVQFWDADGAEPFSHFRKEDIGKVMEKQSKDYIYVVNVYYKNTDVIILSGTERNKRFHGLKLENKKLRLALRFPSNQQIVRTSWYNSNNDILLTGGEEGILNGWNMKSLNQ